jgi:hypothetical protein
MRPDMKQECQPHVCDVRWKSYQWAYSQPFTGLILKLWLLSIPWWQRWEWNHFPVLHSSLFTEGYGHTGSSINDRAHALGNRDHRDYLGETFDGLTAAPCIFMHHLYSYSRMAELSRDKARHTFSRQPYRRHVLWLNEIYRSTAMLTMPYTTSSQRWRKNLRDYQLMTHPHRYLRHSIEQSASDSLRCTLQLANR